MNSNDDMSSPPRPRNSRLLNALRRVRALLATALVILIVGMAMLAGVVNLLAPYANRFKADAEVFLSQRLGQSVTLENLTASWQLRGPRLRVEGMQIGAGANDSSALYVGSADFGIDLLHWLDPRRRGLSFFQLVGDDIELIRDQQGRWQLTGLGTTGGESVDGGGLSWLLQQSSISLRARHFALRDEQSGRALATQDIRLSFNNLDQRMVISGRAGAAELGQLAFVLELDTGESPTSSSSAPASAAPGWRSGRVYIRGNKLSLPGWLGGAKLAGVRPLDGRLDIELRSWFAPDGVSRLFGELDLSDAVLAGQNPLPLEAGQSVSPRYAVDRLNSSFDFGRFDNGWQLQLVDLELQRGDRVWPSGQLTVEESEGQFGVLADFLRIEDLADALVISSAVPERWRNRLYDASPQGEVVDLALRNWRRSAPKRVELTTALQEVSWRPHGGVPGVSGLNLEVAPTDDGLGGIVRSDELLLDFPQHLRRPILLQALNADTRLTLGNDDWLLEFAQLNFREQTMRVDASAALRSDEGGRPFVDLRATVENGQLPQAQLYWPHQRFRPRLLDWLDRSLVSGSIDSGELLLFGDLDDWPFRDNDGTFLATANVSGATLDYDPRWPAVTDMRAALEFDTAGLRGRVESARTGALRIDRASAALENYRDPRLELLVDGGGDGADLMAFLRRLPLPISEKFNQLSVGGSGEVGLNLQLPLKAGQPPRRVSGQVQLENATITDAAWGVSFENSSGFVNYTDRGFEVRRMDTEFRGFPAKLSLRAGDYVNEPGNSMEADLVGSAPATAFSNELPLLTPVLRSVIGDPVWRASLALTEEDDTGTDLLIRSDLRDATVALPVPLAKPASQLMPLELRIPLGDSPSPYFVSIADVGSLRLDRRRPGNASVVFGPPSSAATGAPDGDTGIRIRGQLPSLDLDGWTDWLASIAGPSTTPTNLGAVSALNLTVGQLRLSGRDMSNLELSGGPEGDNWLLNLNGDQIDGRLRIPLDIASGRLLLAEFSRLDLPDKAISMPTVRGSTIDPTRLPPLQFISEQTRLGQTDLGRVQVQAYPIVDGMHFETFEAQSPMMRISAKGDWIARSGGQRSTVAATMTAENIGDLLGSFGVSGAMEGGQTLAQVDASWPGAPADFDLAQLQGTLSIDIGRGQIIDVDPGAGRLIGLLSLQYLPRRLAFDFADFFKSGLTFDSINGSFDLAAGNATTEGVVIESPTAQIEIIGRVGLAARDYQQQVTVTPKVSGALPLIGGLVSAAGSPVAGAVAGAVLQNMLDEPLGKLAEIRYSVTGPWNEPLIETISRRELTAEEIERALQESETATELPGANPQWDDQDSGDR